MLGGFSVLFCGMNDSSRLSVAIADASSRARKCATPDFSECADAPPRSSWVMSSCVTVFTTAGPVTYMYEVCSTITMKSVMAGE